MLGVLRYTKLHWQTVLGNAPSESPQGRATAVKRTFSRMWARSDARLSSGSAYVPVMARLGAIVCMDGAPALLVM